ncbi:MAG: YicC/YloC family endoribonuclease [Chitinophagales bacterium]|nr:YicC/YloC family endoribonuclease [Chitinophagales bacterium]
MIRSMTGYGKATATVAGRTLNLELRSLNSKHLDLNLRLPGFFRQREIEIRNVIGAGLIRGKAEFYISVEQAAAAGQGVINRPLFGIYYKELKELAAIHGFSEQALLGNLLMVPGVVQAAEEDGLADEEWEAMQPALQLVLKAFDDFRVKEGSELLKDLVERISHIKHVVDDIEKQENKRVVNVRERLDTHLADLIKEGKIDGGRLEAEMIFYIERLDITEEIVRLKSHCSYFIEVLNEKEIEKGKKLAFIAQEVGREINTIGSKANDAEMQKQVVTMKEQLEKIKEQLNNVL